MAGRKALPVLATVMALAVASCATPRPESSPTTSAPATPTVGDAIGAPDVSDVADSYPRPENPPYDSHSVEYLGWLSFCAGAFGFSATIVTIPGAAPTLFTDSATTPALRDRWMQVNDLCMSEAAARGWVEPIPTTPEQLRAQYEHLMGVNRCLTELGYGTDPPSEAKYLEDRDWNVYANTPIGSQLGLAPSAGTDLPADVRLQLEIQEACPIWSP